MEEATETTVEAGESAGFDIGILWEKLVSFGTEIGGRLIGAILLIIFGMLFIRLIMRILRRSKFFSRSDATVAHFLLSFIKISMNVILVVSVIAILGVPMSSIVAVIASAGVAIGLALQGALSNLAGGILILIFKPFKIGDYIYSGEHEGNVRDIGIFYTVLTTWDNREITIPNGTVMNSSVVNATAYDKRRVDLDFAVAYGTDLAKAEKAMLEEAVKNAMVLTDPAPFCRLTDQKDSCMTLTLRAWCKTGDYWPLYFDLREAVVNRLRAESIEIPFPQVDVHMK